MSSDETNGVSTELEEAEPSTDVEREDIDTTGDEVREPSNRYEVTIERQYIVYGQSPEAAGDKVLEFVGFRKKPGLHEIIPAKVVEVRLLPPAIDEPRSPIIDNAPSREAQK